MLSEYLAYRLGRSVGHECPRRRRPQTPEYYALRKAVALLTLVLVVLLLVAGLIL